MYDVVVEKFTFAISSPDEFLYKRSPKNTAMSRPNYGRPMEQARSLYFHPVVYSLFFLFFLA